MITVRKLFTSACSNRTRVNSFKLIKGTFRFSYREEILRRWHRLPREVMAAPSLAMFKARLCGALNNLV